MSVFRYLLLASALLIAGCSGLFEDLSAFEFVENGDADVGPDADVEQEPDADATPDAEVEERWKLEFSPQIPTNNLVLEEFTVRIRAVDQSANELVGGLVTLELDHHGFVEPGPPLTMPMAFDDEGVLGVTFEGLRIDEVGQYKITAGGELFEDVESAAFHMACSTSEDEIHLGDGTEESPFLICSERDLEFLRDMEKDSETHVSLIRSFPLPEGHEHEPLPLFEGKFDGQGFEISNLTLAATGDEGEEVGFFSALGEDAEVRNLHLVVEGIEFDEESSPQSDGAYGGLAGLNEGEIWNSSAEVNFEVSDGNVGGLVGRSLGPIHDSSTSGMIVGGHYTGGLVGLAGPDEVFQSSTSARVHDSFSTVGVSATENASYVGGLVGRAAGPIERSWSSGAITNTEGNADAAGGLIGKCYGATISSSHSSSSVTTGAEACGGLVGFNTCVIEENSYASGDINCDGTFAGGLVGNNRRDITDSYATGAVHIDCEESCAGTFAGGLVGIHTIRQGAGTNVPSPQEIHRSFATGDVTGAETAGGLAGSNGHNDPHRRGYIFSSFATGDISGGKRAGGLVGVNKHFFVGGFVEEELLFSRIEDSYATGAVLVTGADGAGAGLAAAAGSGISRSYAANTVECSNSCTDTGGLVGEILTAVDLEGNPFGTTDDPEASYWNSDLTDAEGPGEPRETEEFTDEGSFDGWDFEETWIMPEEDDVDDLRPRLRWEREQWAPEPAD